MDKLTVEARHKAEIMQKIRTVLPLQGIIPEAATYSTAETIYDVIKSHSEGAGGLNKHSGKNDVTAFNLPAGWNSDPKNRWGDEGQGGGGADKAGGERVQNEQTGGREMSFRYEKLADCQFEVIMGAYTVNTSSLKSAKEERRFALCTHENDAEVIVEALNNAIKRREIRDEYYR